MTSTLDASPTEMRSRPRLRLAPPAWLSQNPIILKEMRSRMRGWRSLFGVTGFVALLSAVVSLIYLSFTPSIQITGANALHDLGRAIFFAVYTIELLTVCMIAPALTAGTISTEKEQQTYDLLRATLLSAPALVVGKLAAAISFILLILLAALPLQSIAFIFGGLSVSEIFVGSLILVWTTLGFGAIGIFFSSFIAKTRVATAAAQLTSVFILLINPVIALFILISADSWIDVNRLSDFDQILLFGSAWLFGVTSPAATAIASQVFLTDYQALFFISENLNSGATIYIPSPWLGFTVFYPILTLALLYLAISFIQRPER